MDITVRHSMSGVTRTGRLVRATKTRVFIAFATGEEAYARDTGWRVGTSTTRGLGKDGWRIAAKHLAEITKGGA